MNLIKSSWTSYRPGKYFLSKVLFCLVAQSCPTLWDPMDCSLPGSCPWRFSRQEYWSGLPCSLLQGIFLTQGLNPRLLLFLYCRRILYLWAIRQAPLLCIYIYICTCSPISVYEILYLACFFHDKMLSFVLKKKRKKERKKLTRK